ncbi:MAG: 4Fe-4S binding protein [Burkholderiaceae bacterium]
MLSLQRRRRRFQIAFFALFLLAPALDLLRFDLHATQLWVLGQPWSLGIDDLRTGRISANAAAMSLVLRGFLPVLLLVAAFLGVAWRHGRLYCGWLCPHFSLVEVLDGLLKRAIGRLSLWDRVGASPRTVRWAWLAAFGACAFGVALLWAVTLLTYLLPPGEIWGGLLGGTLTPNQARFIAIGTLAFFVELTLARHLFCRFGCAVGLFQSLAWMANPRALVMAFQRGPAPAPRSAAARVLAFGVQRGHSRDCRDCRTADDTPGSACDEVCPMRLPPRQHKPAKFSCVQCGLCQDACTSSQGTRGREPLLGWAVGADALRESLRVRRGGSSRPVQHAVIAEPTRRRDA